MFKGWLMVLLFCVLLSGCATIKGPQPDFRAIYSYSFNQVSQATFDVLSEMPIESSSVKKGVIETQWFEGWSDRAFGAFGGGIVGGQWKRRVKIKALVTPDGSAQSKVQLIIRVQEKAPGGTQANTWLRKRPDGTVSKRVFAQIEERLNPVQV